MNAPTQGVTWDTSVAASVHKAQKVTGKLHLPAGGKAVCKVRAERTGRARERGLKMNVRLPVNLRRAMIFITLEESSLPIVSSYPGNKASKRKSNFCKQIKLVD